MCQTVLVMWGKCAPNRNVQGKGIGLDKLFGKDQTKSSKLRKKHLDQKESKVLGDAIFKKISNIF